MSKLERFLNFALPGIAALVSLYLIGFCIYRGHIIGALVYCLLLLAMIDIIRTNVVTPKERIMAKKTKKTDFTFTLAQADSLADDIDGEGFDYYFNDYDTTPKLIMGTPLEPLMVAYQKAREEFKEALKSAGVPFDY